MAKPRRKKKSSGNGDAISVVLAICLGIVSLVAIGVGSYYWATIERSPELDSVTLCPKDGGFRSATIILLDASDALPEVTKIEVKKLLLDAAEAVPDHGLIEIRLLDPATSKGKEIFSKCNPGDGSAMNETTGNPKQARNRWLSQFRTPIERALEGGLNPSETESSPILATLQSIAVDRFSGKDAMAMPKRLIVISDLIEHGPVYSQYQGSLSYEVFKRSPAYKRFHTDLQRADVDFLYIQRFTKKPLSSAEHIKFWMEWVKDNNGGDTSAKKLQGAG